MKAASIYICGSTPALCCARQALEPYLAPEPGCATHLLLPVPSFEPDGTVKGGGKLEDLLAAVPMDATVIGGNLDHPALDSRQTIDLLQDPIYTAENAAVTAHCALGLILTAIPVTVTGQKILVIGAGRIGTCLAVLLQKLGAAVTLAARNPSHRAMAQALGFSVTAPDHWDPGIYRVIVNTVPAPMLDASEASPEAYLLDLASLRGITGDRVHWARGLPGKCVPETSGGLIARRVLELIFEKEDAL